MREIQRSSNMTLYFLISVFFHSGQVEWCPSSLPKRLCFYLTWPTEIVDRTCQWLVRAEKKDTELRIGNRRRQHGNQHLLFSLRCETQRAGELFFKLYPAFLTAWHSAVGFPYAAEILIASRHVAQCTACPAVCCCHHRQHQHHQLPSAAIGQLICGVCSHRSHQPHEKVDDVLRSAEFQHSPGAQSSVWDLAELHSDTACAGGPAQAIPKTPTL